jgi:hypothetical protein
MEKLRATGCRLAQAPLYHYVAPGSGFPGLRQKQTEFVQVTLLYPARATSLVSASPEVIISVQKNYG